MSSAYSVFLNPGNYSFNDGYVEPNSPTAMLTDGTCVAKYGEDFLREMSEIERNDKSPYNIAAMIEDGFNGLPLTEDLCFAESAITRIQMVNDSLVSLDEYLRGASPDERATFLSVISKTSDGFIGGDIVRSGNFPEIFQYDTDEKVGDDKEKEKGPGLISRIIEALKRAGAAVWNFAKGAYNKAKEYVSSIISWIGNAANKYIFANAVRLKNATLSLILKGQLKLTELALGYTEKRLTAMGDVYAASVAALKTKDGNYKAEEYLEALEETKKGLDEQNAKIKEEGKVEIKATDFKAMADTAKVQMEKAKGLMGKATDLVKSIGSLTSATGGLATNTAAVAALKVLNRLLGLVKFIITFVSGIIGIIAGVIKRVSGAITSLFKKQGDKPEGEADTKGSSGGETKKDEEDDDASDLDAFRGQTS